MNTRLAPFDNVKARQAVAYAIDRKALVNLFGGPSLAAPVCQILPPGFPGHEPYCPYTKDPGEKWSAPDLEKAKQLVAGIRHGRAGGRRSSSQDVTVDRNVGVYLQSVLNDLGYKASVKAISPNIQFTYIQNTNNKVQMSVTQWYQDYPAASDFLNVLFGCGSFREGSDSSINIAGFCDAEIEQRMQEAHGAGRDRRGRRQQAVGRHRQERHRRRAGGDPVHAQASRLRLDAPGQLPVQQPVLLDGAAVLGPVGPHRVATALDDLPAAAQPAAGGGRAEAAQGPWAIAGRKLRRDRAAMAALVGLALIVLACLLAPAYARWVSGTDPFRSNLDGEIVVDGRDGAGHAGLDRGAGPRLHADRADLATSAPTSSVPTTRAATSPPACSTAAATRC